MKTCLRPLFVCALLLLPLTGLCAKEEVKKIISTENATQFEDTSAAVRVQMAEGGRFQFVTAEERAEIEKRLTDMAAILARQSDINALNDNDKVSLYTWQEDVNAVLTKRDGRRVICENVAPTGSHRKQKVCTTLAEREEAYRESQKMMRDTGKKSVTKGN